MPASERAGEAVSHERNGERAPRSQIATGEGQLAPFPEKGFEPKRGREEDQRRDDESRAAIQAPR